MAVHVDLRDSLRGLWLAEGPGAYLTQFFPRLGAKQAHLIPIRVGLNVLYGRNGAGKTQMLNALAAASNWEMGPLEGFILQDPTWSAFVDRRFQKRSLADFTPMGLIEAVSDEESTAVDLGWTWGYHRSCIQDHHWSTVLELVSEFQQAKTMLLTRGLRQGALEEGSWSASRQRLLPPATTELVPVLLPTSEAPRVRSHLKQLRESLHQAHTEVMESLGYVRDEQFGEWDFSDSEGKTFRETDDHDRVQEALGARLNLWRDEWAWSPLLNARNVGELTGSLDDHPTVFGHLALHDPHAAVYLPPLVSEHEVAHGDFDSTTAPPIFRPFQEAPFALETQGSVDEIEYQNFRQGDLSREELRELAAEHFEKTVSELKNRLGFLPSFAGALRAQEKYGSDTEAVLMIGDKARASAGSRAEVRWLNFAKGSLGEWLFFDEPEAGLHRTAEADLAATLTSPAWSEIRKTRKGVESVTNRTIVVATHSPEFLSVPEANILHVDEGKAKELTSIDRDNLSLLGLRPTDLLSRVKTFLIVEGEHERIVFEALLGDELHRLRTGMVVARGGKNMKDVFDSQVLFDFTDARIVALLDNVDAHHVRDLWARARDLAGVGQVDEAGALVRNELPRKGSGENRFLGNFLTRALEDGEHERVGAWGLSKEDIILYLPPSAFGVKRSWEDALSQYDPDSDGSLKPWLSKKYGADFSLASVRTAAESLDHIPEDFTGLIAALASRV